jgi:hypothetical protein
MVRTKGSVPHHGSPTLRTLEIKNAQIFRLMRFLFEILRRCVIIGDVAHQVVIITL